MSVRSRAEQVDDLEELANILTWEQASDLPLRWRALYEDEVQVQVTELAVLDERAGAITDGLALLPPEGRRAFLRAPVVASRVLGSRRDKTFDAIPVVNALLAELAMVGAHPELHEPVWSALGDKQVTSTGHVVGRQADAAASPMPIAIDLAGPVEFATADADAAGLRRPSETEWKMALPNLAMALEGMRTTAEPAFGLWEASVDVLALRCSADGAGPFSSLSFAYNARVSLLINAHAPHATPVALADSFLHEAIHSLLLMYEASAGLIAPPLEGEPEPRFTSPWSGRELHLSALTHACFVWYGLYWFWLHGCSHQGWPELEARACLNRAAAGFRQPFSSWLSPRAEDRLPTGVRRALEAIEIRIGQSFANGCPQPVGTTPISRVMS